MQRLWAVYSNFRKKGDTVPEYTYPSGDYVPTPADVKLRLGEKLKRTVLKGMDQLKRAGFQVAVLRLSSHASLTKKNEASLTAATCPTPDFNGVSRDATELKVVLEGGAYQMPAGLMIVLRPTHTKGAMGVAREYETCRRDRASLRILSETIYSDTLDEENEIPFLGNFDERELSATNRCERAWIWCWQRCISTDSGSARTLWTHDRTTRRPELEEAGRECPIRRE
ncbi:hypothetical protein C8R47DRAFT_1076685 [Mycena vitilis]|nr:hypothetical protein C8R47DRAFT_1076685 [Mycena vitilis]